jgi:hypothetical protein
MGAPSFSPYRSWAKRQTPSGKRIREFSLDALKLGPAVSSVCGEGR